MIKQLQRKFAIVAMLIILAITGCVFLVITTVSYKVLNSQVDQTINLIIDNDGYLPEYKDIKEAIAQVISNDSTAFYKYFYIKIDYNDKIIETDVEYMPEVNQEEATELVENVLNNNKTVGYYGNYRYKIADKNDYRLIVFLDCEEELGTLQDSIAKSITIITFGLVLVFIIISALTKKALKPIITNIENQKQFITNAGHELKTPLAVIMADVDVLEMTIGEDNEWINSIKSQSNRLNVLIKSLLSLSNIEEGRQEFHTTQFSITDVIKESVQDFKALLQNKNVIFDENNDVTITADLNMMKQLVTIFLDNAIKYTPDNGTIEIKAEKLKQGKNVRLEFLNTCENVRNINTKKLFDRFYRGDKSRNKTKEGYGIGLSIAKSIVDMHKGKISAFITKDEKICFRVII